MQVKCKLDARRIQGEGNTDESWRQDGCELDARRMQVGCKADASWRQDGCELEARRIQVGCKADANTEAGRRQYRGNTDRMQIRMQDGWHREFAHNGLLKQESAQNRMYAECIPNVLAYAGLICVEQAVETGILHQQRDSIRVRHGWHRGFAQNGL